MRACLFGRFKYHVNDTRAATSVSSGRKKDCTGPMNYSFLLESSSAQSFELFAFLSVSNRLLEAELSLFHHV